MYCLDIITVFIIIKLLSKTNNKLTICKRLQENKALGKKI